MFIELLSGCTIECFGESLVSNSKGPIKRVSWNNDLYQARPSLVNNYSDETFFYSFTVIADKCGESCNTINDPDAWVCVTNKVNNMNAKVFKLMSGIIETRFLVQNESSECKCRLNESLCNSKQKWNHNECRCECKKLGGSVSCKNDYMWNITTCGCKCNEAYKYDKYLDIKNCSCEKRLIVKLVLECEHDVLITTETLLYDKNVTCANTNCHIFILLYWQLYVCFISCHLCQLLFFTLSLSYEKLGIKNIFYKNGEY